jgi:hypothetical protein
MAKMILTLDVIDPLFENNTHQAEVLIGLYKLVYDSSEADRPPWDFVRSVIGYPEAGKQLSRYIQGKFISFDEVHHPGVQPGGLWVAKGFSQDDSLDDWECIPAPVELKDEE